MQRATAQRIASGFLALLLSATVVGGQIAQLAHDLTSRHVLCLEHGELMHLDSGAPAEGHHADRQASYRPHAVPDLHHDHCNRSLFIRTALTAPVPHLGSGELLVAGDLKVPRSLAGGAAISLLLLAPKHSPPQVWKA
jgi:hypothetical protein